MSTAPEYETTPPLYSTDGGETWTAEEPQAETNTLCGVVTEVDRERGVITITTWARPGWLQ